MRKTKSITLVGLYRKTKSEGEAAKFHTGRLCWIWSGQWNQWWGPKRSGYTPYLPGEAPAHHTEAGVYEFSDALAATWGAGPEKEIKFVFTDSYSENK